MFKQMNCCYYYLVVKRRLSLSQSGKQRAEGRYKVSMVRYEPATLQLRGKNPTATPPCSMPHPCTISPPVILWVLCFSGRERLLSQKFAVTSQFVVSAKMWTRTIPTRNCDVLTTFPAQTDDDTLMWVLARLRARVPELNVHVRHHSNTGVYGFYLTASYEQ